MPSAIHRTSLLSRLKQRHPRWLRVLAAIRDYFPWTPLGLLIAVSTGLALRYLAYTRLDLVWLVIGWASLGLAALSPLWVVPVAVYLRRREDGEAAREGLSIETGIASPTGYRLPGLLRFFPLAVVRVELRSPAGVEVRYRVQQGEHQEVVVASDRGRFRELVRRIAVQDPFGLARVSVERRARRSVAIYPDVGGLHRLPSLTSFAAGDELPHPLGMADGDRVELSRYVPGDPARFIHWKVFARTRRLMVRRPERALSTARRVAAFFVAGVADDASAGLCRLALVRGMFGEQWRFATAERPSGTDDRAEALSLLLQSSSQRERGAEGLSAFFGEVARGGPASLMVFVPCRPGPWLAQVVDAVRGRQVRVLLSLDGLDMRPARSRVTRFFLRDQPAELPSKQELETVVLTLRRAGCAVSVFDRVRGTLLSESNTRTGSAPEHGVAA